MTVREPKQGAAPVERQLFLSIPSYLHEARSWARLRLSTRSVTLQREEPKAEKGSRNEAVLTQWVEKQIRTQGKLSSVSPKLQKCKAVIQAVSNSGKRKCGSVITGVSQSQGTVFQTTPTSDSNGKFGDSQNHHRFCHSLQRFTELLENYYIHGHGLLPGRD